MDYYSPLYQDCCYHIYNRGNNGENLFYKHENYIYFLSQYNEYLNEYLDTFAYCLLPNHFHLLVRVKNFEDKKPELKKGLKTLTGVEEIISELFRRLFTSYAKAINKQESRTGSLFQKNFKRKEVKDEHYYSQLIYYIHANPQRHCIVDNFKDYPYSSYNSLLSEKPTKLLRSETIGWFGDREAFRIFHNESQHESAINKWVIEES